MKHKCLICGRNAVEEYCFNHKPRKKLSAGKSVGRPSTDEMKNFFMQIWRTRNHISEVSGERLGSEPLTVFFHHILPKEKYPEAKYDEDNIILLTFDEHTTVERDIYKYEEVNQRRELLKIKYERT